MPEKNISWSCLVCDEKYGTEKEALDCENKPMDEAICKEGDIVDIRKTEEHGRLFDIKIEKISIEGESHKLKYWYFPSYYGVMSRNLEYAYNFHVRIYEGAKGGH